MRSLRSVMSGFSASLMAAAALAGCSSDSAGVNFTLKGSGSSGVAAASAKVGITYVSPASLKLKLYEFWGSTDPLCTDPVQIIDNGAADYVDLIANPTIGTGSAGDGTYECLIIVFSDTIKYTPDADNGACDSETEYSGGVCHSGDESVLPDGTPVNCTDEEDKVAAYFSTALTADLGGGASFLPPDDLESPTTGGVLDGHLVIEGETSSTMFIDANDKIWDNTGHCEMSEADFGFR